MARVVAVWFAVAAAAVAVVAVAAAGPPGGGATRTRITVWAAAGGYGGASYGAVGPVGAMISEQREVEVAANGELRVTGVAATTDPTSVQLRDLSEPGVAITEQRFVPGATTPTELLARHVGEPVTVVTAKGDVAGVLRAVDDSSLVVELGSGDQRRLSVMRRDGYVHDVRVAASAGGDRPSLVWRLAARKPGKHTVELSYRAGGMAWSADYVAVIDEAAGKVDFAAWATITNATGVGFDHAELTLVTGATAAPSPVATAVMLPPAPHRFTLASPVRIGANDVVQVELLPSRNGVKPRSVIAYEAMPDPAVGTLDGAQTECTSFNGAGMGPGRAETSIEVDVPAQTPLPDGRVRLFRRKPDRLELVSEDPLRAAAGVVRIKLAGAPDVTGERNATACNHDEQARTLRERLEVRIDNKGRQPVDVVIREFMWRWPVWRIDGEDRKGVTVSPQTHEYRVRVPARGSQTVAYTVVYAW